MPVLVVDGSRYRVHREPANVRDETDDPGADYDPERAISGMLAAAGRFQDRVEDAAGHLQADEPGNGEKAQGGEPQDGRSLR